MFALVCLVLTADMGTGCTQVCSPNRDPSIPVFGVDGRVVTAMCPPRNEAQSGAQPVPQGQLANAAPRGAEQRSHFIASVEGGLYPVIHGITDMPDGTQLLVFVKKPWLPDSQQRLAQGLPACGEDCMPATTGSNYLIGAAVTVRGGAFVAGPFSFRGQPFRPETYSLEISLGADLKTATVEQIRAIGTTLFETTIQVTSPSPSTPVSGITPRTPTVLPSPTPVPLSESVAIAIQEQWTSCLNAAEVTRVRDLKSPDFDVREDFLQNYEHNKFLCDARAKAAMDKVDRDSRREIFYGR